MKVAGAYIVGSAQSGLVRIYKDQQAHVERLLLSCADSSEKE